MIPINTLRLSLICAKIIRRQTTSSFSEWARLLPSAFETAGMHILTSFSTCGHRWLPLHIYHGDPGREFFLQSEIDPHSHSFVASPVTHLTFSSLDTLRSLLPFPIPKLYHQHEVPHCRRRFLQPELPGPWCSHCPLSAYTSSWHCYPG